MMFLRYPKLIAWQHRGSTRYAVPWNCWLTLIDELLNRIPQ